MVSSRSSRRYVARHASWAIRRMAGASEAVARRTRISGSGAVARPVTGRRDRRGGRAPRATSSGRRCCRSVGASALRRAIAALISMTTASSAARSRRLGTSRAGGPRQDRVPAIEQPPDLLVGLDPRRGGARVAEHAVGHRPVAGGRVVLHRQALALVRQLVERPLLHRLAQLPLDEALPRWADLAATLGVEAAGGTAIGRATGLHHGPNDSENGTVGCPRGYERGMRTTRYPARDAAMVAGSGAVRGSAVGSRHQGRGPGVEARRDSARAGARQAAWATSATGSRPSTSRTSARRASSRPTPAPSSTSTSTRPPTRSCSPPTPRAGSSRPPTPRTPGPATTRSWAACSTASATSSGSCGRTTTCRGPSARKARVGRQQGAARQPGRRGEGPRGAAGPRHRPRRGTAPAGHQRHPDRPPAQRQVRVRRPDRDAARAAGRRLAGPRRTRRVGRGRHPALVVRRDRRPVPAPAGAGDPVDRDPLAPGRRRRREGRHRRGARAPAQGAAERRVARLPVARVGRADHAARHPGSDRRAGLPPGGEGRSRAARSSATGGDP